MTQHPTWNKPWLWVASIAVVLLFRMSIPVGTQSTPAAGGPTTPTFLEIGRCYRITFSITGAPNWKVLGVVEGGWIRAEVDSGPASARREPAWINTAQLVTVRDATCSQ